MVSLTQAISASPAPKRTRVEAEGKENVPPAVEAREMMETQVTWMKKAFTSGLAAFGEEVQKEIQRVAVEAQVARQEVQALQQSKAEALDFEALRQQ
eukprot:8362939-Karenia_brevis.AAC.1